MKYENITWGLGFRRYCKSDADLIAKCINDPILNQYFSQEEVSPEDIKIAIAGMDSRGDLGFVAEDLSTKKTVGILEIRNIDRYSNRCKLEISLTDQELIGKGYGTKIMQGAHEIIFDREKIRKCTLHTMAENNRMITLAKKMGYSLEGVLRSELYKSGCFHDELIFSRMVDNSGDFLGYIPENVLGLIGNTPVVEFKKLHSNPNLRLFGKLEFYNPSGAVKDRAAYNMIRVAESKGLINKDTTIVECTSGNTGIGLAMVCAIKGLKCIFTAPEGVIPLGKRKILESLGAKLHLTPLEGDYELSIKRSEEIAATLPNSFVPHQFENPANPLAHEDSTAIEIIQLFGNKLNSFVSAVGSGGTITGTTKILKSYYPNLESVAVEPENCAALSGGPIKEHFILGIGAGFIPAVLDRDLIDKVVTVSDEEAASTCMKLGRLEGIFCGISSGAALAGALKLYGSTKKPKNVLAIIPDNGVRYVGKKGFFMDYLDRYYQDNLE